MALEPRGDDPLARAVEQAKAEPVELPDGTWNDLTRSIMERVRAVVLPAEPLLAFGPDGDPVHDEEGSLTQVSSRVVRDALRRVLTSAATHTPDDLRLAVEDGRLVTVEVDLVGTYGTDLRALADDVRRDVLATLRDLLGPDPAFGPGDVAITFTDVVERDS